MTTVILTPMKTAVSIPDDVFYAAEELSERLGLSRSELYAKAIAAFLEHQRATGVKEALDAIYAVEDSRLDPVLVGLQALSLPTEEW
jgi:metal-responsive CopG/Arc/MetJ family transcriptional regulator